MSLDERWLWCLLLLSVDKSSSNLWRRKPSLVLVLSVRTLGSPSMFTLFFAECVAKRVRVTEATHTLAGEGDTSQLVPVDASTNTEHHERKKRRHG